MSNLLAVFGAVFLAAMLATVFAGGERNWGYVTLGALIIAALATGIYALMRRVSRFGDRSS